MRRLSAADRSSAERHPRPEIRSHSERLHAAVAPYTVKGSIPARGSLMTF
jgi:hypothetical protein